MKLRLFLVSLMCIVASEESIAQRDVQATAEYCVDYHRKNCGYDKKDLEYKYNSQSKSALFRPGQVSTFTFSAFKGYDYRMTFCAEDKLLGNGKIAFKVWDARSNALLFDSQEQEGSSFEFFCDNSFNVKVELALPKAQETSAKKVDYGCVGFLLQSRPSLKTGF